MKIYIVEVWSTSSDPFTMTASSVERAHELAIEALTLHADDVAEHQAGADIYETTLDHCDGGGCAVARITGPDALTAK